MEEMRNEKQETKIGKRESNLELFRIISMFFIVAHHYVCNSGLMEVMEQNLLSWQSTFLYMFGMWGKTGINCFVLITGYFMCQSQISWQKWLKLVLEVVFYNLVIYAIFCGVGIEHFGPRQLLKHITPIAGLTDGFTSCFLVFYLCIPFLTILVRNLSQRMHGLLKM